MQQILHHDVYIDGRKTNRHKDDKLRKSETNKKKKDNGKNW